MAIHTVRFWLFSLALVACAAQDDEKLSANSYKGKEPPELQSKREHWINAKEPLLLRKLKGRVVWLEFSFLD